MTDYKLMPKQITVEMADAFWEEYSKSRTDDLLMRCYNAMYAVAPQLAEQWEPVAQYYYRVNGCRADNPEDNDCICWHNKGTGPLPEAVEGDVGIPKNWRTLPTLPAQLPEQVRCYSRQYHAAHGAGVLTSRLAREFPRIDPDNPKPLDEEVHCCETVLYRERERLHEALSLFREKQT